MNAVWRMKQVKRAPQEMEGILPSWNSELQERLFWIEMYIWLYGRPFIMSA